MRLTNYLFATLRNAPAEATMASHALMVRAGLVQQVASGLYNYLPLGLRAFKKVENIIRDEMNLSGALEAVMPILVPEALLRKSGRWETFQEELFRLHDRHAATVALSPTNEENFAQLIKEAVTSYKQLPVNIYQIEKKFRDEIRPRYGVMRGKEFTMKDAYSFHGNKASLEREFARMQRTYERIFTRLDFNFFSVHASSGAMGGLHSKEFIVTHTTGEEDVITCKACTYAANIETATEALRYAPEINASSPPLLEKVATPGANTIEKVCAFLTSDKKRSIKTLLYEIVTSASKHGAAANEGIPLIVIIRGDYEVNLAKLEQAIAITLKMEGASVRLASAAMIASVFNCEKGYLAPIRLAKPVRVLADISLKNLTGGVAGANEVNHHYINVDLERDIKAPLLQAGADYYFEAAIYQVNAGGACPQCGKALEITKGIEVGHIFALGDKYTKALNVNILGKAGIPTTPLMGCYGIGVDRCLATVIETHHDSAGICFPLTVAPFTVILLTLGKVDTNVADSTAERKLTPLGAIAERLYKQLVALGIEVLWDDRNERAGVKFNDAALIGIPLQLILSENSIQNTAAPQCEWQERQLQPGADSSKVVKKSMALTAVPQQILARLRAEEERLANKLAHLS